MSDPQQPPTTRAVRLIFEYEGDSVRLVSQQPVDTVVTGFDTPPEVRPGHFVEARDSGGKSLVRVPARGAFLESAEVFPEDHAEPITRVDVEARGAFTVIVPTPAAATQVAVVRVAPPAPGAEPALDGGVTGPLPGAAPRVDLGTFPLEAR
ncbi:hypothetical protein OG871_30320 [Kitasatospora sp. NBC_00374]|uniref:hypothetical protein n=1 Tax=Kitasatospora sp. NBC_00374 TaxID=2975964 RepID=UPI0030E44AA7